jgi:predicted Zn finger-like uncharacterized protein
MQFSCDSCKAQLQIADEKVRGKRLRVRCRRCGALIALADPAFPKSAPRVVSAPPPAFAAPAVSSAPPPAASPAPAPVAADAPRSDVEITRAMETEVLERALQASAAEGAPQNGATAHQGVAPEEAPADGPIWFAMLHGKQTGPLTRAELDARANEGEVGPRTYLWREGMDSWQRAKDVAELGAMFPQFPGSLLPTPEAKPLPASSSAPPARAPQEEKPAAAVPLPTPAPQRQPQPAPAQAPAPAQEQAFAPAHPQLSEPEQPLPGSQVWQMGESAAAAADLQEPIPALPPERGPADVARELFASGEHSISQKNAIDLARWATDELDRKKGGSEHARMSPPVIAPSTPMFETASPKKGKGALIAFVILAALGAIVLVLWILLGGAPADRQEDARPEPRVRTQQTVPVPAQQPPPAAPKQSDPSPSAPQAKALEPSPQAAPPASSVGLTAEQVRRKLDESKPALQACIDEVLRRDPKLRVGKIHIAATIAPNGQVVAARIDKRAVDESPLGVCLKRATRRIAFPSFGGAAFDVDIPIVVTAGD